MKHVLSLATLYPNPTQPRFGTFVARSLEALNKRDDWQVSVINPIGLPPLAVGRYRPLAGLPPVAVEHGISVHRPRFTLIPHLSARRNHIAIAKAALPLVREIHKNCPIDVLDAQFFYPDGPAAATIAKEMGLPLSIKARGSDIQMWAKKDFARQPILDTAEQASGLLAVSEDLARQMGRMGMDRDKITIHYTGLDRDRFRPLDHTGLRAMLAQDIGFDLPKDAPLFACVGALIERKGQALLLEAMREIEGSRAILVGTGADEAELRALARKWGLEARVHFAGSVDHDLLPVILSAADIMVLPTREEGLANAWVEAIACGTPIVTCDVGGARELLSSPVAGRLVERNAAAITAAIRTILDDKPRPQDVSDTASRFSWDHHASELAAYYERLTSNQV